jgi:4-hydroxybenzoate polyprenyltransferase
MERKDLESAAASYSYLRGLLSIPLGILCIVAALGNVEWGPLRHAWVFVACVLAAAAACLGITRYYNERYGRVTPSTRQQRRLAAATTISLAVMVGASFSIRSEAGWSLDLPVNPVAASFALFMLIYYGMTVGLKAHHIVIWGSLLLTGLLPVWGDVGLGTASNVGLVLGGVAAIATGIFDHRLLARTFRSSNTMTLENGNVGA